jgi:hypothetical protein
LGCFQGPTAPCDRQHHAALRLQVIGGSAVVLHGSKPKVLMLNCVLSADVCAAGKLGLAGLCV